MPSLAVPSQVAGGRQQRVLIVDDHVDSADLIAHWLQGRGHETRVAYDAVTAVALAAEFRPQLALLDINLPDMDGHELGIALSLELADCRFIALTGDTASLTRLRSEWAGFHGHLTKPCSFDQLITVVAAQSRVSELPASGTFVRHREDDPPSREATVRRARERSYVDLQHSKETIRYWTTALGCAEPELRAAVAAVGHHAEDVRHYLRTVGLRAC